MTRTEWLACLGLAVSVTIVRLFVVITCIPPNRDEIIEFNHQQSASHGPTYCEKKVQLKVVVAKRKTQFRHEKQTDLQVGGKRPS